MEAVILLLVILIIGQVGLVFYVRSFGQEPVPVDPSKEQKSRWALWHQAMRKSQAVMGKAELESVKIVADTKYYTKQLETVYEDQLRQAGERMEKELNTVMAGAQKEFGTYLVTLQEQSQNLVDDAMTGFTKRLEESLTTIETRILKLSQDEEMRVKLEVEAYRKKMLANIDNDIAEILDEVSKKVLGKGLSTTDQTKLIIEALERAKKDKFI